MVKEVVYSLVSTVNNDILYIPEIRALKVVKTDCGRKVRRQF
jgi:hypothetical protein